MIDYPQCEGMANMGASHYLDHDCAGNWYLIPHHLAYEWVRRVNNIVAHGHEAQTLAGFEMFRVKPSKVMRSIYPGEASCDH